MPNQYRLIFESKMNRPDFNADDIQNKSSDRVNADHMRIESKAHKIVDCGYKFWDEEIYD